jgi:hypothetical protein
VPGEKEQGMIHVVLFDGRATPRPAISASPGVTLLDVNRCGRDRISGQTVETVRVAFRPEDHHISLLRAFFGQICPRTVAFDEVSLAVLEATVPPVYPFIRGQILFHFLTGEDCRTQSSSLFAALDARVSCKEVARFFNDAYQEWQETYGRSD